MIQCMNKMTTNNVNQHNENLWFTIQFIDIYKFYLMIGVGAPMTFTVASMDVKDTKNKVMSCHILCMHIQVPT